MSKIDMPIGINPIILDEEGKILLGLRKNCYGAGTWGLPGGKLQMFETFEETAVREIKEETNLDVMVEDIDVINLANSFDLNSETHFIQIGVLVKKYEGLLKVMEPEKCEELRFFDLDNLPEHLFVSTKMNIELYKMKKFYNKSVNSKKEEKYAKDN